MDAIKHTPWKIGLPHPQNACAYVVDSEGNDVAALYGGDDDAICTNGIWSEQPIRDAHARLIAAAPELLTAIKDLRNAAFAQMQAVRLGGALKPFDIEGALHAAAAAIARATGGDA